MVYIYIYKLCLYVIYIYIYICMHINISISADIDVLDMRIKITTKGPTKHTTRMALFSRFDLGYPLFHPVRYPTMVNSFPWWFFILYPNFFQGPKTMLQMSPVETCMAAPCAVCAVLFLRWPLLLLKQLSLASEAATRFNGRRFKPHPKLRCLWLQGNGPICKQQPIFPQHHAGLFLWLQGNAPTIKWTVDIPTTSGLYWWLQGNAPTIFIKWTVNIPTTSGLYLCYKNNSRYSHNMRVTSMTSGKFAHYKNNSRYSHNFRITVLVFLGRNKGAVTLIAILVPLLFFDLLAFSPRVFQI